MSAVHRFVASVARPAVLACGLLTLTTAQAEFDLNGTYDVGTLTPLERPETVSYTHLRAHETS